MTENIIINNIVVEAVVKTQDEMRALYQQDLEMATRKPYKKGNTITIPFGKAGCVTYTKRLREKRLVRKVWRGGILRSTCVCHI